MEHLLEVKNLHVSVGGKEILPGVDLSMRPGEIHALMGPNGSGKSTLAQVLMGHPSYQVTSGSVLFNGKNLLAMKPEERSRAGIFLAFQNQPVVSGLAADQFLRTAVNAHREARGEKSISPKDFQTTLEPLVRKLGIKPELMERDVHEGFSGGERKRLEVLQLLLLRPQLAVLDETDSGLDVDALKLVAESVNELREPKFAGLVITHYQRLLHLLQPTHVHVMAHGCIVRSGGPELVGEIESKGYEQFVGPATAYADK